MQRESGEVALQVEMKVIRHSKVATPDADMNWVVRNYKKLQVDYPDKWIAAKSRQVVEFDTELEPLLSKLKEKHGSQLGFAIEFIGAKPRNLLI